jgi:hypothetical protein
LNPSEPRPPLRESAPLWVALAACVFLQFWIANGAARLEDPRYRDAWHHYEYLAEGFLHGHTYLSLAPDPQLLKLRDPYDPDANAHFRLWDASLYQGRYYLYFGPTPALFMAAARVVSGHMIPQRLAAALFAAAGLVGLALLLRDIRRRHFPGLSPIGLGAILIVAFHASWLPVTLRRPAVWEVPIVASVALVWWSIFFLWRFHASGGKARWALAGGATLAFLIGSRATYVFSAGAISLLFLVPAVHGTWIAPKWRTGIIAAALVLAGGFALLVYNKERFGSWLEFGMNYQLWGDDYWGNPIRMFQHHFFSPTFFPFDARSYLLSPPRLGPYFPFLQPAWTDDLPPRHQGYSDVFGVLPTTPVHMAGLVACAWAWRHRSGIGTRTAALTLAAAACASVFAGLVLFMAGGVCSRYITELLAGWTVATAVGLMLVFAPQEGRRPGKGTRVIMAVAALWSVGCVWLASAGFQGCMAKANPGAYAVLAHVLDYPSQWWIQNKGIHFGAAEIDVRIPDSGAPRSTVLVASGRPQHMNRLVVNQVDRHHVQLVLLENERRVLATPTLALTGGLLRVRLDAPWLYPPPAHPYWDGWEPAARENLQTLFSIAWNKGAVSAHEACSVDPVAFEPLVNGRYPAEADSPYVDSIETIAQGR